MDSDITEAELLAELAREYTADNEAQPGEFTAGQLVDELNKDGAVRSKEVVRGWLEKLVKEKKMTRRGGRGAPVFYKKVG